MKLYSLKIKDSVFKIAIVSEEEDMKEGLADKPELAKGRGLLFNFKKEQKVSMNMVDMNYPLDMIFISDDREVVLVEHMDPGNNTISVDEVLYVLEVNAGEGKGLKGEKVKLSRKLAETLGYKFISKEDKVIKEEEEENIIVTVSKVPTKHKEMLKTGGRFKIYEEDVKSDPKAMQVLDETGKVLMNIKGGERIFSINHTEMLVKLAKKIDMGEANEEELGKLMAKIIQIQNTQEPEYVYEED